MGGYILNKIVKSPNDRKKYRAFFSDGSFTDFGAVGYDDYTTHKDVDRWNNYITRHQKDLRTNDPRRAGYLSMFILWNKPSFAASVKDYQKRLKSNDWSLPNIK